jgi:predicted ATPase
VSKIAEYNPIHALKVPGLAEAVETCGLVVIVGPNSSGKTLLLKDIENTLIGTGQKPIVCQELCVKKPVNGGLFIQDLLEQKLLRPKDANTVIAGRPHVGRSQRDNSGHQPQSLAELCTRMTDGWMPGTRIDFFVVLGRLLLTSLFLENRLSLYQAQGKFDQLNNAPDNELQALSVNRAAQKRLEEETGKVFGNAVWLDQLTVLNQLLLRVSGTANPVSADDRIDVDRAKTYRSIEDEGHGLKSYVGIAIGLLLGRRPVCLIDEPELCLHPPQAYALGRFIGEYGTAEPHVTFVATHSSHTLRGIIETAKKLTVLRMTNIDGKFRGHLVNDQELRLAVKRRTTRAETVLDGIFSQAVVIVEAEGDRAVYPG